MVKGGEQESGSREKDGEGGRRMELSCPLNAGRRMDFRWSRGIREDRRADEEGGRRTCNREKVSHQVGRRSWQCVDDFTVKHANAKRSLSEEEAMRASQ